MKKITILITLLSTIFSFGQVPVSERTALIALYNSTNGSNWNNSTNWNTSEPVSNWYGVTVENILGADHVTKIELSYNNLSGQLTPEIGNLTELKIFVSNGCQALTGEIPSEIGGCTQLEQLELSWCNLTGNIPESFSNLINLKHLYLGHNQLSGEIPDVFNSMDLMSLEIGKNDFSGNMILTHTNNSFYYIDIQETSLISFDFRNGYNTNISNSLYFQAKNNPSLTCIFVDDIVWSETHWTNIDSASHFIENQAECDVLNDLIIEKNALIALYNSTNGSNWTNNTNWNSSEPISTWYGITVENISGQDYVSEIHLGNNNLTGVLPSEIGSLSHLKNLDLHFNFSLSGNIPNEIGSLSKLEQLSFWDCDFTGTIPNELGNCSNLWLLSLEDNQLTGNIPISFSNLTAMKSFWLNGNELSGDVPDIFTNWGNLDYFSIGFFNPNSTYNSFTGTVDLSNNPKLRLCYVYNNGLSELKVNNGNNINFLNGQFDARLNPNLTCIFVDDKTWSENNWSTKIGTNSHFVETEVECNIYLSVNDEIFKEELSVFPNPTHSLLNIQNNGISKINMISITDLMGQKVLTTKTQQNIDISYLNKGIYLITITSENGNSSTFKLMID